MPEDTMIAAIYARKSQEQEGVADEAKSLARQEALARQFIAQQGWTVAPAEYIVHDDGISGADFVTRALMALVQAASRKPRPFDVLVTMDQDRIGREQVRTPMLLLTLKDAGVRVFYYASGEELKLDTPMDQLMSNMKNFGNEWYRYQVRVKTKESLRARAEKGQVAGGNVYGYRNVPRAGFTERAIHPAESAVVVLIFQLCAQGLGHQRIALRLNDAHTPRPEARGGGFPARSPASCSAICTEAKWCGAAPRSWIATAAPGSASNAPRRTGCAGSSPSSASSPRRSGRPRTRASRPRGSRTPGAGPAGSSPRTCSQGSRPATPAAARWWPSGIPATAPRATCARGITWGARGPARTGMGSRWGTPTARSSRP
jgi:DNA invertase Pin-like site-specific DNA recombinase